MLKPVLLIIAVALAALLLFAATRPDTFLIQRSVSINASAERLFPLINDLRQFNTWNPFALKDPNAQTTYRGPASGVGAIHTFDGNKEVGTGSIEITGATAPRQVSMRLRMTAPMAADNAITFTLVPQGPATQVTWAMEGKSPFLARLVCLFFNMDRMVGGEFETGLAALKRRAEAP